MEMHGYVSLAPKLFATSTPAKIVNIWIWKSSMGTSFVQTTEGLLSLNEGVQLLKFEVSQMTALLLCGSIFPFMIHCVIAWCLAAVIV